MFRINVVFFASLKESIGLSEHAIELSAPLTIGALKQRLAKELQHGQALLGSGVQSSIDFEFSRDKDTILHTAREVAFFPPVTGG
ncbi:MoaD/ThiS family protein [Marinomonas sp. IMCC 4694]|uniref:MoaD/ThiS family protein n=1 Tax=Marinomonas sp. IMCC 4694 TaxID=2605432 RepID=UPI0011E6B8AE|nr:MoaD/ThiS family protein [Marinomonas sp. IMCC 4694]TYL48008.1 MoaD/ThiS family protein [Marinomonas sp. IMCC 4694]